MISAFAFKKPEARIRWEKSGVTMRMEADGIYKHAIIYCPKDDKRFFAFEPVTNCNNGFNMHASGIENTGAAVIKPGESLSGDIRYRFDW